MTVYTRSHIQMLEEIDEGIQYLSALNTRNKWVEEKRNIAPKDVVFVVDPGNPQGHWPLGRKGQSCTCQNGRQRFCATNHNVVSVGDINRTEGIEHSPI